MITFAKWRRRVVSVVMAFVIVLATPFLFLPGRAETTPQTLKVYAQYFADPNSVQLLGEYSRAELEALSYTQEFGFEGYYSNVTRVKTVMRVHARGVRLSEFLENKVGIDLNSIRTLHFHTTDVDADARFVSKGRYELLDSPHYYFPNLVNNSHHDQELDEFVIDNEAAAREGAVEVPTILAVVQYATKNPLDDLSEEMTSEDTFRLCAGSPDLTTVTSFESARWVDEIYIELAGQPPEPSTEPTTDPTTEPATKGSGDKDPVPSGSTTKKQAEPSTKKGSSIRTTTRRTLRPGTTRPRTTRYSRVTRTTRPVTVSQRTVTMTTRPIAEQATATGPGKMDQLVVEGYDSLIQWKKDSPDNVEPLQKPVVTTKGARNAAILFLLSFAAGAFMMFRWFIKER